MIKVVLAGQYPEGTYEAVRKLLPETEFSLAAVDTQEAYDLMTDAQIMILRIFKAPREVMERNKNLKMILRWGAGYDSVDIKAAGENGILVTMLMCHKVTHKKLIDNSPLFRKNFKVEFHGSHTNCVASFA